MTKDELLDVVDELVSGDATLDDVRTAVDAYSASLLKQTPVSGSLPTDKKSKVQRIVNMAMSETGLSEDEVYRYMLYLLKCKEIEKRGCNDR